LVQNKKALEFVSENGQELARHMFFTIHNDMESTTEYFWNIFRNTHLFKDKDHALLTVLLTFISIWVEIETQAVYRKYGDDVYTKLGEHVSSYYKTFLVNFSDDEEELALFLMHHAHETVLDNDGEDNDVLLAVQFKKIAATEEEFSPSIFQPFAPILLEGESIVDIIESNI
jgi:hypothetical protein